MKSKFLQLMLIVWALTVSFAANAAEEIKNGSDANVYGHVIDKKTGEHLPYVVIQVKGTTIATTTDDTGHYFLKKPAEWHLYYRGFLCWLQEAGVESSGKKKHYPRTELPTGDRRRGS